MQIVRNAQKRVKANEYPKLTKSAPKFCAQEKHKLYHFSNVLKSLQGMVQLLKKWQNWK